MEQMDWWLLLSRGLHIAAAIIAIGGAFFVRMALQPAAVESLSEADHAKLREAVRSRWAKVVGACIGVLLLTGGFNFLRLAMPPKISPMPYHAIFGVKLLAALAVFFIASALAGRAPGFARLRARSRWWLGMLLVLAAIIIALSGVLSQVRGWSQS